MEAYLNRLSTALFALVVAGGLAFGGSQALSSPSMAPCGDDAHEVGTCPPLNDDQCNTACKNEGFNDGGACHPDGCCRCLI